MPTQEPVHIASGVHQLFLDDVMIAEQTNLISTLHPPTKFVANPVVMPTPGVETEALLYGTVLYDERAELFKMWYYTGREGTQMHRALAYAPSEDGIAWEKPNLDVIPGLGEPANIVMVHPQTENFGEPFSVIIDDRDPDPARRYKLVYRYLTPPPQVAALGTTTAVSADGIHWQPFGEVQIPDIIDIGHFFFDELTGKYTVYGRLWAERRKVQLSVSDAFVTWTEPVLVLDINENDPPGSQFYTLAVYNDGGQYVGLGQLYTAGTTHLLDFELLSSRDGRQWRRVHQGEKFIPCGVPGEWDRFNNSMSCDPVRVGDELWFYYSGRTYRHSGYSGPDSGPAGSDIRAAIGLARLRVDGYVSLSASYDGGSLTTVPLLLGGEELHVNVDSRWGEIVVEVLGTDGQPLAGYISQPITENGVDVTVAWPEGTNLTALATETVQLRFTLKNARLYSYWVQ